MQSQVTNKNFLENTFQWVTAVIRHCSNNVQISKYLDVPNLRQIPSKSRNLWFFCQHLEKKWLRGPSKSPPNSFQIGNLEGNMWTFEQIDQLRQSPNDVTNEISKNSRSKICLLNTTKTTYVVLSSSGERATEGYIFDWDCWSLGQLHMYLHSSLKQLPSSLRLETINNVQN